MASLEEKSKAGDLTVKESWNSLSALDYAGVVLKSLKTVAGIAPFGSQLQACIDLAQAIVDNVKDMQSFRASEDDLTKRVADTLRIIAEALQKRTRRDARQLKQDLRPMEIVMEDITVFTSKQKTKNSLQRFMDAGEDLKRVQEFNSDINDTLLQLHMKLMLDVDSGVKSLQWAQKKRHDELMDELGQLRAMVGKGNKSDALQHSNSTPGKRPGDGKGKKDDSERPSEKRPWKAKASDKDPDNLKKDENKSDKDRKPGRANHKEANSPDKKGKAPEKNDSGPRAKVDDKDDKDRKSKGRDSTALKKSKSEKDKNRGRNDGGKDVGLPPKPTGAPEQLTLTDRPKEDDSDQASTASDIAVANWKGRDCKNNQRRDGDQTKERRGQRRRDEEKPDGQRANSRPEESREGQDDSDRASMVSSAASDVAVANWNERERVGNQRRGGGRARGRGDLRGRDKGKQDGRKSNSQGGDAGFARRKEPVSVDRPAGGQKGEDAEKRRTSRKEAIAGEKFLDTGDAGNDGNPRPRFHSQSRIEAESSREAHFQSMRRNSTSNVDESWSDFNQNIFVPGGPMLSPMVTPFLPNSGAMFVAPQFVPSRSEEGIFDVPTITVLNPETGNWSATRRFVAGDFAY